MAIWEWALPFDLFLPSVILKWQRKNERCQKQVKYKTHSHVRYLKKENWETKRKTVYFQWRKTKRTLISWDRDRWLSMIHRLCSGSLSWNCCWLRSTVIKHLLDSTCQSHRFKNEFQCIIWEKHKTLLPKHYHEDYQYFDYCHKPKIQKIRESC